MEQTLLKIRDEQQASWNQYSPGWKRWEAWTRMMLEPIGTALIDALELCGDEHVLDIATGAGEPGITIASKLPFGKVTGTDIAEGMLETATESAERRKVFNYDTLLADACHLPFADGSFDAVACRHGFMFFPDVALAAREAIRVLKPGGRFSTSIWASPEENVWASAVTNSVRKHTVLPMPKQHLFQCSKPGFLGSFLKDAGLSNIHEETVYGTVTFNTALAYWRHFTSVVMPVAKAISHADADTQHAIRNDVFKTLEEYRAEDGMIALSYAAVIISGTRP